MNKGPRFPGGVSLGSIVPLPAEVAGWLAPVTPGSLATGRGDGHDDRLHAAGRDCARRALAAAGITGSAGPGRGARPPFPPGSAGSIAHTRRYALAVATRSPQRSGVVGLGVDIEPGLSVHPGLAPLVLGAREPLHGDRRALTRAFVAKEAAWKALPAWLQGLDFGDAEVRVRRDEVRVHALGVSVPVLMAEWNGHAIGVVVLRRTVLAELSRRP